MDCVEGKIVESVTSIFSLVTDYENPQNHISFSFFSEQVISVIESGVHEKEPEHESSFAVSKERSSSLDFLLCALTSVVAVFDYSSLVCYRHTGSNKCTTNSLTDATSTFSEQAATEHLNSKDSRQKEKWYCEAAKMLVSHKITVILVKCLKHSCQLTRYLSKKALLCGVRKQYIQVSQILRLLEQELSAHLCPSTPVLETLRDLLSHKLLKDDQIIKKTFSYVQKFDLLHFITNKISDSGCAFSNSVGLLEYLSFLHKLVKCGMDFSENSVNVDYSFVSGIAKAILLPHAEAFLSLSRESKGHLIASKYLKVVATLLDSRFVRQKYQVPLCIFDISNQFLTLVMDIFYWTQTNDLLVCVNFVGNASRMSCYRQQDKKKVRYSSLLVRLISLVTFKACAIVVTEGNFNYKLVKDALHSLWHHVILITGDAEEESSKNWLPSVFGDQDDHWVTALFCLQIIHKGMKERLQTKDDSMLSPDESTRENSTQSSDELIHLICPHRLFLQLAKFVDYDHLVIADFLTSPETSFLQYFTQHLHAIANDWNALRAACSTKSMNLFANAREISKANSEDKVCHSQEKLNLDERKLNELDQMDPCSASSFHDISQNTFGIGKEVNLSHETDLNVSKQKTLSSFTKRRVDVLQINNSVTASKLSLYICEGCGDKNLNSKEVSHSPHPDESRESLCLVSYSDSDSEDCIEHLSTQASDKIKQKALFSESDNESMGASFRNEESDQNETYIKGHTEDKAVLKEIDNVMGMLIRLRFHIERLERHSLFPYNPKPLLRLLEACENVYEGQ